MDLTVTKLGELRYCFNNSQLSGVLVPRNAHFRRLEREKSVLILDEAWSNCFDPEIVEFFRELKKERGSGIENFYFAISTQAPLTVKFTTYNKRIVDKIKEYFKKNH